MIGDLRPEHYREFLRLNEEFVHWLSPLDEVRLKWILERADYARQIESAPGVVGGVLIGYPHNVDYPDHKNLIWLSQNLDDYFYIDRIIIDGSAQGRGYGARLYQDIEDFARRRGYQYLACEVNTKPANPGSHRFHEKTGFQAIGDKDYPKYDAALRYYAKKL